MILVLKGSADLAMSSFELFAPEMAYPTTEPHQAPDAPPYAGRV